ncbi:MMPL family transporter [Cohnella sp. REN36]|uniref:MMPL family transporter n=1 Tax=Cohnella sp. REN36 TaxID=2887347 RepID=UPI001D1414B5|nr:MMPL family transporter [Cohnella sp. REN36]MCC3371714.1 MMPL family transporter [Cohnella sp. REN36]
MSRLLARLALRHARLVIAGWLVFVAVCGGFAVRLPGEAREPGLTPPGDHEAVMRVLAERFGVPERPVALLFERDEHVSRDRFDAFIREVLRQVEQAGGFGAIASPIGRPEMQRDRYAYATLAFEDPNADRTSDIRQLQALLSDAETEGLSVRATGTDAIQADVNAASRSDLRQAERIGLPIALLVLWLALGGLVPAMIPIAAGLASVVGAMGIMALAGRAMTLSVFVIDVLPMVGLALSIDFGLLLASRYRHERHGRPIAAALERTIASAGSAIVVSGLCMLFGLIGILSIRMPIFRSVALGAAVAVALAVLAALTLVPALLGLLGDRYRPPAIKDAAQGGWQRFVDRIMRRPIAVALTASALLAACIVPAFGMKLAIPDAASLPAGTPSRQAAEEMAAEFGMPNATPVWMLAESRGAAFGPADWADAEQAVRLLAANPRVLRVDAELRGVPLSAGRLTEWDIKQPLGKASPGSPTTEGWAERGNLLMISVLIEGEPGSREAREGVRSLAAEVGGLRLYAGGEAPYEREVLEETGRGLRKALPFIGIANLAVLVWRFRSLLVPLKAVLMNFASIAAAYGATAWLFDADRLGSGDSAIAVMIPVFVFGLTFGISMDYGVFLFARIRERYVQTGDNERAVREGLAQTGPVITAAAAILLAVTLPFAFGDVTGVRQLGIGIAAAVSIDATIVRMLLVPALMKLFGRWNWWLP